MCVYPQEDVEVTVLTSFDPNGSGAEVWQPLRDTGRFSADISPSELLVHMVVRDHIGF